jgi:hypothetical protein
LWLIAMLVIAANLLLCENLHLKAALFCIFNRGALICGHIGCFLKD